MPIKGPGKFEGETYVVKYAFYNPDDEIGSVDELGWYGNFSGRIKHSRKSFHIITSEDSQGFVSGKIYDTHPEMIAAWSEIEEMYDKYYEENGDENG